MRRTGTATRSRSRGAIPPAPGSTMGLACPPSRATRAVARATRSSCLPRLLTEQTARTQDHDGDQVAEYDRLGPLRPQAGIGQRLDDADDQAAEHRTADVADASHDG